MIVLSAIRISEEAQSPLRRAGVECLCVPDAEQDGWKALEALPAEKRAQVRCFIGNPALADEKLFALLPNLRWLQGTAAGLAQDLRWDIIEKHGAVVTAARIHEQGIAELVLGMLLSMAKNLPMLRDKQAAHDFDRGLHPVLMQGKRALIIGAGNIGERCARLLKGALDMATVGISRSPKSSPWLDESLRMADLAAQLPLADAVVLALPHTPETENLLGEAEFAAMKESAYLINIGRGALVDEDALLAALREGRIAGAASDVFWTEPLPADSPLWDEPRLLITPHIAGYLSNYNERICEQLVSNIALFEEGSYARMTGYANEKHY